MKIGQTKNLPGYRRLDGSQGVQMAPQILTHDGKRYLALHSEGFTTGLIVTPGQDRATGRIAMTTWCDMPDGRGVGTALTFTPDDDMIDVIIGSLTRFRDEKRAAALQVANSAIERARGK